MKNIILIITLLLPSLLLSKTPLISNDKVELAKEFVQFANDYDGKRVGALFDLKTFAKRTAKAMNMNPKSINSFVSGFLASSRENFGSNLIAQLTNSYGQAEYVYNIEIDGISGPMIRFDYGEQGINYLFLIIERNSVGNLKIIDIFSPTNDAYFSELAGDLGQLAIRPNKDLLSRIFKSKKIDASIVDTFKSFAQKTMKGDSLGAYKKIKSLPDDIRKQRLIMALSVSLAGSVNDELYMAELSLLAKEHASDPAVAFYLVDYFYLKGKFPEVIKIVENFEKKYKSDGYTNVLKGNAYFESQKYSKSLEMANRCIELEEFFINCYWLEVNNYLSLKKYPELINRFKEMEQKFYLTFTKSEFLKEEIYDEFVESKEFKDWLD